MILSNVIKPITLKSDQKSKHSQESLTGASLRDLELTYSGGVCFIDQRLEVVDVTIRVRVLEHDGRNWFIDFINLVQVDNVHFKAYGLSSSLHACNCLRVQPVWHQESFPLVYPSGSFNIESELKSWRIME